MPRTQSAKKALRQNVRRRTRNLARRARVREAVKQYKKAASGPDAAAALARAYQTLDKMAKVGFIKKGKARRFKSRLAKKLVKSNGQ